MTEKRWGSFLLGAIVLAAGSACAVHQPAVMNGQPKDVGTPIILIPSGTECTVDFKQPSITSYQDKFLKFKVINYCEKQQVAMVGNFRTAGAPSANPDDCKKAMDSDSFAPIFQDDSEKKRTASPNAAESDGDPSDDTIKLKIRKTDDLPKVPGILEYDFDVCLGGKKADPRLVIER